MAAKISDDPLQGATKDDLTVKTLPNYDIATVLEFDSLMDILAPRQAKPSLSNVEILDETLAQANNQKPSQGGRSLCIFGPKNWIRIICTKIVTWRYFDVIIIVLIIINSLLLGVIDYENPNSDSIRN